MAAGRGRRSARSVVAPGLTSPRVRGAGPRPDRALRRQLAGADPSRRADPAGGARSTGGRAGSGRRARRRAVAAGSATVGAQVPAGPHRASPPSARLALDRRARRQLSTRSRGRRGGRHVRDAPGDAGARSPPRRRSGHCRRAARPRRRHVPRPALRRRARGRGAGGRGPASRRDARRDHRGRRGGRPRPGARRAPGRRARSLRPGQPVPRAGLGAADAGALPGRATGGCARRLRTCPSGPRRRPRHRARLGAARHRAGRPRPRSGAPGAHRRDRSVSARRTYPPRSRRSSAASSS